MMGRKQLPYLVLVPQVLQVAHIGLEGGLHESAITEQKMHKMKILKNLKPFHDKITASNLVSYQHMMKDHEDGFGGWGHPADHYHCLDLFGVKQSKSWSEVTHLQ